MTIEIPVGGPENNASPACARNWRWGFWSLIATQFQGAFNDNGLKYVVIYIALDRGLAPAVRDRYLLFVGALFALPFLMFSLAGGYLADRYSKRSVTIATKVFEVGVMIFALLSLASGNLVLEAAAVFLISTQGAFFGPSKYGLLPELLPDEKLSWGNGVIELGTFLAVITSTMAAGYLAVAFRGRQIWSGAILLGFTLVGLATSFGISHLPAANPAKPLRVNPFTDLREEIRVIRRDRLLAWAVGANTYFWFLAALLQFVIAVYGHDLLHLDDTQIGYLQAAVGIGIGMGSLAAGYLSFGEIEYGLVPLGALGITVMGFLVSRPGLGTWTLRTELALLGFFGGFYVVPVNALIQHRPSPEAKGGVIATANLFTFVGIFLAAGMYYLLSSVFHLNPAQIALTAAILTLATTAYAIIFLPDSVVRLKHFLARHLLPGSKT